MYVSILKFEAQNGLNDPNQMTHIAVKSKHRLNVTEMIAHVNFHYRDHHLKKTIAHIRFECKEGLNNTNQMTHIGFQSKKRPYGTDMIIPEMA